MHKRELRLAECSFDHMISYNDWIHATVACKHNVYYKSAVQLYMDHPVMHMYEKINEEIRYFEVEKILDDYRNESKEFLNKALKE